MATIINVPRSGRSITLEQIGKGLGVAGAGYLDAKRGRQTNQTIAQLFDEISSGKVGSAEDIVEQGGAALDDRTLSDLLAALSRSRSQKSGELVTVDVEKLVDPMRKTKVKLSTEDILSGIAEQNLNKAGYTFARDKGGKGKATDTDKAIGDFLSANKFDNNSVNRNKARQYLKDQDRIDRIIGAEFGKEVERGVFEWANPADRKRNSLARMYVKQIMFSTDKAMDATSAAKLASDMARQNVPEEEEVLIPAKDDKSQSQGGIMDRISAMLGGGEQEESAPTETPAKTEQPATESVSKIGTIADTDIILPDSELDQLEEMDMEEAQAYIKKRFPNLSDADITAFLLEN